MFGIIRPCRHRLGEGMRTEWMAHLCGLCLALRGEYGQFARMATNYDGLVISVLTEAQSERTGDWRRGAGPCPLRGMRSADVAQGEGARLAATVSLVLAAAKIRDHVADGDGLLGHRPMTLAARRIAHSWDRASTAGGRRLGFDTAVLLGAVERQPEIERLTSPGTSLLAVTEPTETATAAAFAHTAVLAGRPDNAAPLAEAGRLFGRLAHLLDAIEDFDADEASNAWNPIAATGTDRAEVRRLCDDAVHGIRLALDEVSFVDGQLVRALLGDELERATDRAFDPRHRHHRTPGPRMLPWLGRRTATRTPPETGTACGTAALTGVAPDGAFMASGRPSEGQCRRCGQWRRLCAGCGVCSNCCLCIEDEEPWQFGDDNRNGGSNREGSGGDGWFGGRGDGNFSGSGGRSGGGDRGSGGSGGGSGDGGCCNPCKCCCDCCD
ncbi:DUF5685 family protein [Streptomyces sp. NPDC006624]|uniref:DUF5685 family protein n=1 Tax=unclassified Streptomyces TaxID=2593676 RepID=UPI0033B0DFFE